jgi:hypothetical protein
MEKKLCFVCKEEFPKINMEINKVILLPVCPKCKDTENEAKCEREHLDSLAEGFICGCI